MKKTIQTNLCGQQIMVNIPPHCDLLMDKRWNKKTGTIRSVFLDEDNNPRYTICVEGTLLDCYAIFFKIV